MRFPVGSLIAPPRNQPGYPPPRPKNPKPNPHRDPTEEARDPPVGATRAPPPGNHDGWLASLGRAPLVGWTLPVHPLRLLEVVLVALLRQYMLRRETTTTRKVQYAEVLHREASQLRTIAWLVLSCHASSCELQLDIMRGKKGRHRGDNSVLLEPK